MSLQIDCRTYNKAALLPVGTGYEAAVGDLRGIVWHSTEHQARQSFAALCRFLQAARDRSVHYIVGPDGGVVRFLDPGPYKAWGAGKCAYQGHTDFNTGFVQIELYHRAGDPYPAPQLAAARELALTLRHDHPTIQRSNYLAHRWIAYPPGRRADPTDLSDAWLRTWFATL